MGTGLRLKRITTLTSTVIAAAIAIAIPLGYFVTSYVYESERLQDQANVSADTLSKHIYLHPDTWQFQVHRLEDLLSQGAWRKESVQYRIVDIRNEEISTVGDPPRAPIHVARTMLTDGGKDVGWIEAAASLRPLYYRTSLAALVALFIAWSVRYVLRVLPFAALERVMKTLEESQKQLALEVEEKESALNKHQAISEVMRHQATHDALTELPNRAYFNRHLRQDLEMARHADEQLSVMIIDLNRFKEINDALGHQTGDEVLVEVSKRIRGALPEDTVLARLGGDEYAVLISDAGAEEATRQAGAIVAALHSHIVIDEYHLSIHGSIGIAYFPEHGETPPTLMRHADIAMYHAKQNAQPYCFYDRAYDENSPSRLSLTADLRQAIDNDALMVHFQPKVDLFSGEVMGAEALARWLHPKYGAISPDVFIPLAEQGGMINPLTEWVVDAALQRLAKWQAAGLYMNIAVNISARSLQNEDLPRQVKQLLQKHNVRSQCLTLEITEGSIMTDPLQSKELINNLAEWGVRIAVDDFGTGYSSLAYLKRLTVHELKIDKSFVLNVLRDKDDQVIVRSTIELAHNLNLAVVAEGVENQQTYDLLREYGCDSAQGYYIGKPISADVFEGWLECPEKKMHRENGE